MDPSYLNNGENIRKKEPGEVDPGEYAVYTNNEQPYTDEGSEFLDDIIREEEQPLKDREESGVVESHKVSDNSSEDVL